MTLLLLAAASEAATLNVGPTQPYRTINAAVTASASGDVILVEPGVYAEDLDLRGRTLTVQSSGGPAKTTITPTTSVRLDGGVLEGFSIAPAPATAILISSGSPTLRELHIQGPSSYGVQISGGNALIEEVGVWNAGIHGFIVSGGAPVIARSVSYEASNYGFAIKSASFVKNSVAIGGAWGFVFENAQTSASHLVAVGASSAAVAALYASTVANSVFQDNTFALKCFNGAVPVFPNGMAYNTANATNCTGTPLAAVDNLEPGFTSWSAGLPLAQIDLRPTATAAMRNVGTGTDTDGSVADLGAFGGSENGWRDRDGDGYPVLFDCDDRDADTYVYADERADGYDNDCDGIVDEDIPVDTGDTDVVDTGDTDVVDTGDTDDTDDTDTPTGGDLDGDLYLASVDCDEHNRATYPGAREIVDGADNDCDGAVDEGTPAADDDLDGYSEVRGDCDDTRSDRYPGAEDTGQDGVDNDCDGAPDDATGADRDSDGFTDTGGDCDDTNAATNPDAVDTLDGVDSDCDGTTDQEALAVDADGDGQTIGQGDCDDGNPATYTGAVDTPDDFIDQDCSGTDNYDADRDGDPSPASGGTDCDDTRSTVYPGAAELCGDNADNDCDGSFEEDCEAEDVGLPADTTCGCGTSSPGGSVAIALAALVTLGVRRRRDGSRVSNS